ncbi:MAG: arginase family protein [Hyphomicrobiaceae bacterium]
MIDVRTLEATELYAGPATFMGVPHTTDASGRGAAILGCPFDCGTHPFRVGSRQGPQSIRAQSGLVRRYQSEYADYDALERLGVVDCGDVRLVPSRMVDAFDRIEEAAYRIAATGAVPVGFGGDGSVSLPLVRAASRVHPNLAVLHIDSHTDAYEVDAEHPYDAATQFTHAALEQRVSASASFHIGLRGSTTRQGVYAHGKAMGYNLLTMREFWQIGPDAVVADIIAKVGGRPVYLSWDMDVFDPSCAPGVCTPVWGGFSAREGLDFLRRLGVLEIVGADVNTVSPPQDVNGATAFLAAAVTYEMLLMIEARKSGGARG